MSLKLCHNLVGTLQFGETESKRERERKRAELRIRKTPRLGAFEERPQIRPQLLQFQVWRERASPKINPSPILAAQRVNIYAALLGRKARRGIFSPSKYFITLPRLGSCIYMWTGRLYIYRKRNAMYTVLPKYARTPKIPDALVFLRSLQRTWNLSA